MQKKTPKNHSESLISIPIAPKNNINVILIIYTNSKVFAIKGILQISICNINIICTKTTTHPHRPLTDDKNFRKSLTIVILIQKNSYQKY